MRAIAYATEPASTDKNVPNYWETIGATWGFDKVFRIDPTGAGNFVNWAALRNTFKDASYIFPVAQGGTPLAEFKEPDGDVIYIINGDYEGAVNDQGLYDEMVTVESALKPGVGTWSFLAMSVIAHSLFRRVGAP